MTYKPDLCIHHGSCADGFTAAWVVWSLFGDDGVQYRSAHYGQEPPDVAGKNVLIVDFSYKRPVLDAMAQVAKSIVVLDHHKTALEELAPFRVEVCGNAKFTANDVDNMLQDMAELGRPAVLAEFDMDRSGAQMAWDFYHSKHDRPRLVEYVADRDLWQHKLPGTKAMAAFVSSHEQTLTNWTWLAQMLGSDIGIAKACDEGSAILRKQNQDIDSMLAICTREMVIGGVKVPVANLPYTMASDAAGRLALEAPFAATYFDLPNGRVFSLRSRGDGGADVSQVAKAYGGGGHKNAAGFTMPVGWDGDK